MTSIGYTLDDTPYVTEEQLDWVREQFIMEWRAPNYNYCVWHRNYKDYEPVQSPYKNLKVIVVNPKEHMPRVANQKCIFLPFRYLGVPIVVWK